ncbi:hypothetical protein J22TS1_43600 [Siminovitchia terrae]|uniref:hypothetical protein n=1 Tax=Siminovitchia terrae TaxID=1914933 RepID=UPI001B2745AC|nr:hypothetical protein [Siminovitchia terrae]GIN93309.1 hypothetical protein J22TS1_43600 [Siminovitchia terrae]
MLQIPDNEREIIDQAIFLPMLLKVLQRDLAAVENIPFKLKTPYQHGIENTIKEVQKDLSEANRYLYKNNVKIVRGKTKNNFTDYTVIYKGGKDQRHYFNAKIQNTVEDLLDYYLVGRKEKE